MLGTRQVRRPDRRGFSLIELLVVLVILGVVAGLSVPRLNLSGYRVDAIAQQVRAVFQTSQRTSLTRQYDVMVSIDTVRGELRIVEDANNNGIVDTGELRTWRPTGQNEGNVFAIPPKGLTAEGLTTPVVGSTLKRVNGYPTVVFHRDGSTSSDAEVYVANRSRGETQFRLVTLTRSTGRTELYKLAGKGATSQWQVSR